TWRKQLRQS
ncbi:unnamed protein product, partial [Allacma fusca]